MFLKNEWGDILSHELFVLVCWHFEEKHKYLQSIGMLRGNWQMTIMTSGKHLNIYIFLNTCIHTIHLTMFLFWLFLYIALLYSSYPTEMFKRGRKRRNILGVETAKGFWVWAVSCFPLDCSHYLRKFEMYFLVVTF